MEFSKQGQVPMSTNVGSQPVPSSNIQSNQAGYPSMFYPSLPGDWSAQPMFPMGASVPISSYYIVPMSQQSAQIGASRPEASRPLGAQPLMSRVSLRPPQQVLNIQTSLPAMVGSHPSPSAVGKKSQQTVASPKVQMLKSTPLQSSNKRSTQKEAPSKVQPQQLESVRTKFRESLAAALSMDSDQQNKSKSPENVQPDRSAGNMKPVEGDAVQDPITATSKDESISNSVATVATKKSEDNEKLVNDLSSNMITGISDDMQRQSNHVSSGDELLGQCMVADELLQGHGLSWVSDFDTGISELGTESNLKRPRTSDVDPEVTESLAESESKRIKSANDAVVDKDSLIQKAEGLAFRIEEELFKLFGGVNKKYKEKGRSLLFNLKDKSNPELRERVLSGDIAPERLCSMTAEELASKELSEWRLAKAEELAQMVVLPNTEVDVRRLVRKTHKGEFQVEVEEPDGISVEVELGGNVLTNIPSKAVEDETKSDNKTSQDDKAGVQEKDKASDGKSQDGDGGTGKNDLSGDLEYIDNEKADLMQELMVDDIKDSGNLPPILSLDEFMEGLDSEPPFVDLSVGTPQENGNDGEEPDTTLESEELPEAEDKVSTPDKTASVSDKPSPQVNSEPKSESPGHAAGPNSDVTEGGLNKSSPSKDEAKQTDADNVSNPDAIPQSKEASVLPLIRESIWEGAIQLTMSSLTNVVAIFKSGEKPSLKDWRSFVEIKGRVKLSAFQEFVEQLPKSRSRAIMITELCWKEGSPESGRQHLLQTIDSYVSDDRVGLAEPADGIELYLCPSQGKTVEILSRHLPNEHLESLSVAGTSFIGVVVWRRPNLPRVHSHHRHDGSRRQSILRKPQVNNSGPRPSLPLNSYGAPPGLPNQRQHHEEDVTDDVPPGFGPGVARDEDDLPEFNFVNSSNPAANVTAHAYKGRQHFPTPARPAEQMRELVQKYGKRSSVQAHPWDDDDDDDIPEWNPNQATHQPLRQQPLPPAPPQHALPPSPPVQQMHPYHQQQYLTNAVQPQVPVSSLPQAYLRTQQTVQQLPLQQQLQPAQPWQQPNNAWWPAQAATATAVPAVTNMVQQPQYGVVPNNSSVQGYEAWRPR